MKGNKWRVESDDDWTRAGAVFGETMMREDLPYLWVLMHEGNNFRRADRQERWTRDRHTGCTNSA